MNSDYLNAIGFYIFYAAAWLLSLLPLSILYILSDILYFICAYIFQYRKKVVIQNLRNSFPEKSIKEINKIALGFYRQLCDYIIETMKLVHISSAELSKRVVFQNPEIFEEFYQQNRNVALVSGHYGNWSWMIRLPLFVKHKPTALYRTIKNKYFNDFEKRNRERYGAITIPMDKALRTLMEFHQKKEIFITWFLVDQWPSNPYKYWTTFLNQDTAVYLGAEKIAAKINAAVVYMEIKKTARGYYRVNFSLICENAADYPKHQVTEMFTKKLEETIVADPQHWLWSHKRWKDKKNHVEI